MTPKTILLDHIAKLQLVSAALTMVRFGVRPEKGETESIIDALKAEAARNRFGGEIRRARRLERRARAVSIFHDYGLDPVRLFPPLDFEEGYSGKILMVSISGATIKRMNCLRSGDLWHHEILKDAEEEIQDTGFENAVAAAVGGAWIRFDSKNAIQIYGTSDTFGECDKQLAASLICHAYPLYKIYTD